MPEAEPALPAAEPDVPEAESDLPDAEPDVPDSESGADSENAVDSESGADAEGAGTAGSANPTAAAPEPETEITEIRIGKIKDEESGQRFAARSGFDFTVTLSKYDAEKVVNKTLADLAPDPPPEDSTSPEDDSETTGS